MRHVAVLAGAMILLASCSSSKQIAQTPARASTAPPAAPDSTPSRASTSLLVPVARVYLDPAGSVHAVQVDSQDVRVTYKGRYRDPELSPDRHTVGMLAVDSLDDGTGRIVEVSSKLKLLRGGGFFQEIETSGFIRSWAFVRDGKAVAVYSGPLHFAGTYELYDTASAAMLESAKDPVTDASPDWVRALSP